MPEYKKDLQHGRKIEAHFSCLSILVLCALSRMADKNGGLLVFTCFGHFSREKNWHKLRKMYRIWQVATVRSINHNLGALKELICSTQSGFCNLHCVLTRKTTSWHVCLCRAIFAKLVSPNHTRRLVLCFGPSGQFGNYKADKKIR